MSDGESKAAVTMVRGAPATRYEGQAPATSRYAMGGIFVPHGPVVLHGVAHELGERLQGVATGQAELFGLRDRADVVLKVYFAGRNPKGRATKEMLERYQAIRSPHLMRLLDFGFGADGLEGQYDWELLELLEPLRSPLEDGPRDAWLEQRLAPALGSAAEALLSAALVHCDIKPANVMQRPSTGEIVLVDIGSLKGVNADTRESVTTLVATTSAYAAPELLRKHVNEKTDAFSIGMTLFEFAQPGSLSSPRDKEVVARISRGQPILERLASAPRLHALVNGLTRQNLTTRWGGAEYRQWMSGGVVPEPAEVAQLPTIKWRKQNIHNVSELLDFIQDESAFWEICENEGDLPFTLRQWVNIIHDDEMGAALSRLVKRSLAENNASRALMAIRRVIVPDGRLSVAGKSYPGDASGAIDALLDAGFVSEEVELSLRIWAHRDSSSHSSEVVSMLARSGAEVRSVSRIELQLGLLCLPTGWPGERVRSELRAVRFGRPGAEELDAAAMRVIGAIPFGEPDQPWRGNLNDAVLLLPLSPQLPNTWALLAAAQRRLDVISIQRHKCTAEMLRTLSPEQFCELWDWMPARAWVARHHSQFGRASSQEEAVELLLRETGRPWLVAGQRLFRGIHELSTADAKEAVLLWIDGSGDRAARFVNWWSQYPSSGGVSRDATHLPSLFRRATVDGSQMLLDAHQLLWSQGARGVFLKGQRICALRELSALGVGLLMSLQAEPVFRRWLEMHGDEWGAIAATSPRDLFAYRVLEALGETALVLADGRQFHHFSEFAPLPPSELHQVLGQASTQAWLERSNAPTGTDIRSLHHIAWRAGGRGLWFGPQEAPRWLHAEDLREYGAAAARRLYRQWDLVARGWLLRVVGRIAWDAPLPSSDVPAGEDNVAEIETLLWALTGDWQVSAEVRGSSVEWNQIPRSEVTYESIRQMHRFQRDLIMKITEQDRRIALRLTDFLSQHRSELRWGRQLELLNELASLVVKVGDSPHAASILAERSEDVGEVKRRFDRDARVFRSDLRTAFRLTDVTLSLSAWLSVIGVVTTTVAAALGLEHTFSFDESVFQPERMSSIGNAGLVGIVFVSVFALFRVPKGPVLVLGVLAMMAAPGVAEKLLAGIPLTLISILFTPFEVLMIVSGFSPELFGGKDPILAWDRFLVLLPKVIGLCLVAFSFRGSPGRELLRALMRQNKDAASKQREQRRELLESSAAEVIRDFTGVLRLRVPS